MEIEDLEVQLLVKPYSWKIGKNSKITNVTDEKYVVIYYLPK